MNRAIAAVYAISIGSERGKNGEQFSHEVQRKLIDKIPDLVAEIERLDAIVHDPFIRGYLEAKEKGLAMTIVPSIGHTSSSSGSSDAK